MQPPNPFHWIADELVGLDRSNLRRARRTVKPLPGGKCEVNGRIYWDLASNDYLDLSTDPRLIEAACQATRDSGTGARASALVTGRTPWHQELESKLAEFKGSEAALLFPTGYAANVGVITSLVGPGDEVFCDRLNHASLIDGCRLSRAKFQVYPHNDVAELRRLLSRRSEAKRRLIVTDSLFSMDGDVAPLQQLAELAQEFNAILLVDEAHATGVFGDRGTGLLEATFANRNQPLPECIVATGTLSKALGSQGGFVTGPHQLIDWFWNSSRSQMFSTALTPGTCAAAITALGIVKTEPERRWRLRELSQLLRQELGEAVSEDLACGPIIPVILGIPERTLQVGLELEEQGIQVGMIRPPTVPQGSSRLRVSLKCSHHLTTITHIALLMRGERSPG